VLSWPFSPPTPLFSVLFSVTVFPGTKYRLNLIEEGKLVINSSVGRMLNGCTGPEGPHVIFIFFIHVRNHHITGERRAILSKGDFHVAVCHSHKKLTLSILDSSGVRDPLGERETLAKSLRTPLPLI